MFFLQVAHQRVDWELELRTDLRSARYVSTCIDRDMAVMRGEREGGTEGLTIAAISSFHNGLQCSHCSGDVSHL